MIRRFGPMVLMVLMSGRQMATLALSGAACGVRRVGGALTWRADAMVAALASSASPGPSAAASLSSSSSSASLATPSPPPWLASSVSAQCVSLGLVLLRPAALLGAATTLGVIAARARRATPLPVEVRSYPAEVAVH